MAIGRFRVSVVTPDRRFGYFVTILGVVWISPDALLQRLIDDEPMRILGWRGMLSVLVLWVYLRWRNGGWRFSVVGWRIWVLAASYGLNSTAFVLALHMASVADVLVILAATPLFGAILGWFVLGEVPGGRVQGAIALGMVGVIVAAVGGISGGAGLGMLLAAITTILLAVQFTLLRLWPWIDNVAAVLLGSAMMGGIGFLGSDPLAMQGPSLAWCIVLGLFLTPIAFTLVTIGPRHIGGAEVSLLMLLETALGPLWVWLALGEEPQQTALIGGAIIVMAVVMAASSAFRRA